MSLASPPTPEQVARNQRLQDMAKAFGESAAPQMKAFSTDLLSILTEYASMKIEGMRGATPPAKPKFTLEH